MSVVHSLLLLLCFSIYPCNSRRLTDNIVKDSRNQFHVSDKDGEKALNTDSPPVLAKVKHAALPKEFGPADEQKLMNERPPGDDIQNPKQSEVERKQLMKSMKGQSVGDESLVSVSFRVPHKKPSEKQPGFNLDYAPPKIHPPHHN